MSKKLTKEFKSKLHSYFQQKIGAFDYKNGWMKSDCPHCGKAFKFGINLTQNKTNCFVCETRLSPIDLVMKLENLNTYSEVASLLAASDFFVSSYREEDVELKSVEELYLPEHFVLFGDKDNSQVGKSARSYLKKRGFNIDEVRKMGWGYCIQGKYIGYMIIPFITDNKLVYFNARRFIGSGPKYNNPENSTTGIGKSYIIYNSDALYLYDKVYLCEGAINARTMGENGISSGGKSLSRYQINAILRSPVRKVVILLDPDAKQKAIEIALKLFPMKRVKVYFTPDGTDVNDVGRKMVIEKTRELRYMNYKDLITLKNKITNEERTIHSY